MARTTIAVNDLTLNAGTILTRTYMGGGFTGTAGYSLTGVRDEDLRILIENLGATGVFTIKAGDTYCEKVNGDLSVVVGGGGIQACIGPIDGARFRNSDATVYVDAGNTGAIWAVQ